jgi:uncharacterized membrane protein
MKYTTEIEISKSIDRVVELFDNPANLDKWMEGLLSFEPLSGTPGHPGAKSRLRFKMGKREIEMIETITTRNLPDEFTGTYEAKGVYNIVTNRFVKLPGNRTKYISEHEFQFTGIMKLVAFLMPGAFRKQSMKYLADFKKFAESQN